METVGNYIFLPNEKTSSTVNRTDPKAATLCTIDTENDEVIYIYVDSSYLEDGEELDHTIVHDDGDDSPMPLKVEILEEDTESPQVFHYTLKINNMKKNRNEMIMDEDISLLKKIFENNVDVIVKQINDLYENSLEFTEKKSCETENIAETRNLKLSETTATAAVSIAKERKNDSERRKRIMKPLDLECTTQHYGSNDRYRRTYSRKIRSDSKNNENKSHDKSGVLQSDIAAVTVSEIENSETAIVCERRNIKNAVSVKAENEEIVLVGDEVNVNDVFVDNHEAAVVDELINVEDNIVKNSETKEINSSLSHYPSVKRMISEKSLKTVKQVKNSLQLAENISKFHKSDKTHKSDSKTHKSDSKTHKSDSETHKSDSETHKNDSKTHKSDSKFHKSDSKTHKSDSETHKSDSKTHKSYSKIYKSYSKTCKTRLQADISNCQSDTSLQAVASLSEDITDQTILQAETTLTNSEGSTTLQTEATVLSSLKKVRIKKKKQGNKPSEKTEESAVCKICDKVCKSKNSLRNHMVIHDPKKTKRENENTVCEICNKVLKNRKSLRNHMLIHDPLRETFKCEICGAVVYEKHYLREHIESHQNRLNCFLCNKTFKFRSSLTTHMREHMNDKKYMCDFCAKSFVSSSCLVKHRRTHTKVSPFECKACNKVFAQKVCLRLHMANHHTREFKFLCDFCGKGFAINSHLMKHKEIHIKNKC